MRSWGGKEPPHSEYFSYDPKIRLTHEHISYNNEPFSLAHSPPFRWGQKIRLSGLRDLRVIAPSAFEGTSMN